MPSFFATAPRGTEDLLEGELKQLGIVATRIDHGGVGFSCEVEEAYQVCLWSRIASRVLLELGNFEVNDYDDLYEYVVTTDWMQHFDLDNTFSISCRSQHAKLSNTQYAVQRIKDGIVDYFMKATNRRPDVERQHPQMRVHIFIGKKMATLYLDLSGEPLHRRGYRRSGVEAPMRENLAAAILKRAGWQEIMQNGGAIIDPMCGSGTLLIEAGMMAANIAPGFYRREFGFTHWKQHRKKHWGELKKQALNKKNRTPADSIPLITGCDINADAIRASQRNIEAAGLDKFVHVELSDHADFIPGESTPTGIIVTNPPYGERMSDVRQLVPLYTSLGEHWKQDFSGWRVSVFSANDSLLKAIGLRAHKTNALYNGAIKCKLAHFRIGEHKRVVKPGIVEVTEESTRSFVNRLGKNYRHLKKWARKNDIECYRVYDADLPEYSMAIDIYGDYVHVQEYAPPKSVDAVRAEQRLQSALINIPEVLGKSSEKIVCKQRKRMKGGEQYEKRAHTNRTITVKENDLTFLLNLHDYIDTGLFLDHRITRKMIASFAKGKHFLNLYAYTGTASVYAAAGGAHTTTTVDLSNTYLSWAKDNMVRNGFKSEKLHRYVQADCLKWLSEQRDNNMRYDLVFLDPPTFSNSKSMEQHFDLQKEHVSLIQSCLDLLSEDAVLVFSNNFRKFRLDEMPFEGWILNDISKKTIPEDFRGNAKIHRCWLISRQAVRAPN